MHALNIVLAPLQINLIVNRMQIFRKLNFFWCLGVSNRITSSTTVNAYSFNKVDEKENKKHEAGTI